MRAVDTLLCADLDKLTTCRISVIGCHEGRTNKNSSYTPIERVKITASSQAGL